MPLEHIEVRRHRISGLDICDVTMDDLDAIERMGSDVGLDFNVALFSLGVGLSFLTSLLGTKIESERVFDTFVIFTVVGGALAVIFFIKWFMHRGELSRLIQKIRERQIGPTGDEGKALKPQELNSLPSVEPPAGAAGNAQ
jgi:hypothetical protein